VEKGGNSETASWKQQGDGYSMKVYTNRMVLSESREEFVREKIGNGGIKCHSVQLLEKHFLEKAQILNAHDGVKSRVR
jgi:hypothetical protein